MIIEGIVTTEADDGSLHVAPIGPHVNFERTQWVLKPFQSSRTFAHLRQRSRCVFHVVDDPLLMAQAVLGLCNPPISQVPSAKWDESIGWVLDDCCGYFALATTAWDLSNERAIAECSVVQRRDRRSFWGWNRAAHSILELSILVSRRHLIERSLLDSELERHRIVIDKTAGEREQQAYELISAHLKQ